MMSTSQTHRGIACVRLVLCSAFVLVTGTTLADGWHRSGELAPASRPPQQAQVSQQDGPELLPPRVASKPASTTAKRKVITSDPAPEMPDVSEELVRETPQRRQQPRVSQAREPQSRQPGRAAVRPAEPRHIEPEHLAPSHDDQWAERILSERNARLSRTKSRGEVRRASHDDAAHSRQYAPSAFSQSAYYQQPGPTITSDALGAPDSEPSTEELPAPGAGQPLPPINTDHLLKGYSNGEQYFHHEGEMIYEGSGHDFGGGGGCDSCGSCGSGGGCGDCGSCGGCGHCGGGWGSGYHNLSVFGGAQGFKGPVDYGRNGNFGFHYGLNYGAPIWMAESIGYQIGGQIVHSNLSGSNVFEPTDASRTQYFITAGLFRRASECSPWQWGVAYDWLSDNYYVNMQFAKVRVEGSFVASSGDEIGAWASLDAMDDTKHFMINGTQMQLNWKSADLFAFFWRRHFCGGGNVRLWGGFTDNGDGLVGGDFRAPLSDHFGIEGNSNYLVPTEGGFHSGATRESWNVSLNLVFYIGGGARASNCSPFQPLFNVADNSIFMFSEVK